MLHPLSWQDGVPTSTLYDDIYFSKDSGLLETNHVFLDGNNLPQRWSDITGSFHIIETGFGTGLNFFAAWKLLCEQTNNINLHYTSIEKHPLSINDIRQAISLWPEMDHFIEEFFLQYPFNFHGESALLLNNDKIHLNLLWGDVNNILPSINNQADAWFLDGFSPQKNPDMWNDILYAEMARLTNAGGTFATFTSSGNVRRGLQKNGFTVTKASGFGKKRHILVGVKN